MIDRTHELAITRQTEILAISRGVVYYRPRPMSEADQALIQRIDVLRRTYPRAGARTLRDLLRQEGFDIGRKHVATLMDRMGIKGCNGRPVRHASVEI